MTRYYRKRQVIIDVLANLYKEKRVDMIPALLETAKRGLGGKMPVRIFQVDEIPRNENCEIERDKLRQNVEETLAWRGCKQ